MSSACCSSQIPCFIEEDDEEEKPPRPLASSLHPPPPPPKSTTSSSSSSSAAAAAAAAFDPLTGAERSASAVLDRRVADAVRLLDLARDLQAQGDFPRALLYFTQVVKDYKDLALSEYARVGRALVLYEIGDRDEAIAEMEDVSVSLKGYPEIHAALAAALYADKHAPLLAENQFAIATLLDPHYTDLSYVKETKHWPPSLVSSLQHFITLS
uniref:Uncharacterized protein n=1 Tax=Ananas comosus var. bracteatus TaxID=296719 RepID=A0A6V7QG05_ANACO|nr:unnamed protein product [Ananas comosus var. bracteatus]